MIRRILALVSVLALLGCLSITAYAHDVPDMERKGSIEITMTYDGDPVPGGTLTLYRVGEVCENDGNYSFEPTGDFADCGESFEDVQSSTLAGDLAEYARDEKITGTTRTVSDDGTVQFTDLELGLYLVVQNKAAKGYNAVSPFLVTVPKMTDGKYVYDVDATPKMGGLTPTKPTETTGSTTPTDKKLPQTGQLNWPVPMLAVVGMLLFAAGWVLRFGKRENG